MTADLGSHSHSPPFLSKPAGALYGLIKPMLLLVQYKSRTKSRGHGVKIVSPCCVSSYKLTHPLSVQIVVDSNRSTILFSTPLSSRTFKPHSFVPMWHCEEERSRSTQQKHSQVKRSKDRRRDCNVLPVRPVPIHGLEEEHRFKLITLPTQTWKTTSNTATQQHSNTATQQHSNTATQQHSNTATQQLSTEKTILRDWFFKTHILV